MSLRARTSMHHGLSQPRPIADPDLNVLHHALEQSRDRTGRQPILLGGWTMSHPDLSPPAGLCHALSAIPAQTREYAYARTFMQAKSQAAKILGSAIRFDGKAMQPDQITVTASSSMALLLALAALRAEGVTTVIAVAPCYYSIVRSCRFLGLHCRILPTDFLTGTPHTEALAKAAKQPDVAFVMTNPCYSIGKEFDTATLRTFWSAIPPSVPIIMDETRLGLHWQRTTAWPETDYPARSLIVRSPSKLFGLNGLKCTFLFGKQSWIRKIEHISDEILGSLLGHTEAIALTYLGALHAWQNSNTLGYDHEVMRWRSASVNALRTNVTLCNNLFKGTDWQCAPVDSGPYVLVGRKGPSLNARHLTHETGVFTMTAPYFYHAQPGWSGFRINLGLPADQIREAVTRLLPLINAPYHENRADTFPSNS